MELRTAILRAKTMTDLAPLVAQTKENISLLGHRYIYLDDCEETLPIDALPLRIMELVSKGIDIQQHPEEEKALKEMIPQITAIYKHNDARWNNPITFVTRKLRDIWNYFARLHMFGYDTRFHWAAYEQKSSFKFSLVKPPQVPEKLVPELTRERAKTAIADATTFDELLPLVEAAKEDISFLGCRYITLDEHDESVPLQALAKRVMDIAKSTLSVNQDKSYQEIVPLINALHEKNETTKSEKNLFTRTFCSIRDQWNAHEDFLNKWKEQTADLVNDDDSVKKE